MVDLCSIIGFIFSKRIMKSPFESVRTVQMLNASEKKLDHTVCYISFVWNGLSFCVCNVLLKSVCVKASFGIIIKDHPRQNYNAKVTTYMG